MFGANYNTPVAKAYRWGMMAHYVKCDECGETVCGDYATGKNLCRYAHDDCFSGDKYDDGVFCGVCR